MKNEKIQIALQSAYSLLSNEVDSIDQLKNEYLAVIKEIEIALNEINKDE